VTPSPQTHTTTGLTHHERTRRRHRESHAKVPVLYELKAIGALLLLVVAAWRLVIVASGRSCGPVPACSGPPAAGA
jgi:hypothetical protein